MPMVDLDWTITRATGDIRYIGDDHGAATPSYATVIEFHRWLQDFADQEVSAGDDEHDITDNTSSDRSTDNIITLLGAYNIDANAAEHLYDGSIIQGAGGTAEFYDGIVNFGNASVQIQLIQNGAVIVDDWWNFAGGGLNPDANAGISHRFMVLTHTSGADIDGRRLIGTSRTYGNTYSEFSINGTSRGNNVLALVDTNDLNNSTASGTVAGYTGITNVEGYRAIDVDNNGADEFYYSEWNTNQPTRSINDFYERMKYNSRDGSAETLYGLSGELFRGITHAITIDTPTGTFAAFEAVSWPGGTGQMLAINSTTAGTEMWIQLLTGVAPVDNELITGASTATALVNVTVISRAISTPFIGQSTGSALIGAYGVGVEAADLSATDTVFDLGNNQITPPNNVTFTVFGLESGEDRVLVTNDNASAIDFTQMALNTTLNGATETSVVVGAASIPADTPNTGTLRIELDDGRYRRVPYISYAGGNTFTIASTDFTGINAATATANVFLGYIDLLATGASEAFTTVYDADRTLFIRVRDGGVTPIRTFETTGTLGSSGGSATAIRTTDE